jgi:hypothetical protein
MGLARDFTGYSPQRHRMHREIQVRTNANERNWASDQSAANNPATSQLKIMITVYEPVYVKKAACRLLFLHTR